MLDLLARELQDSIYHLFTLIDRLAKAQDLELVQDSLGQVAHYRQARLESGAGLAGNGAQYGQVRLGAGEVYAGHGAQYGQVVFNAELGAGANGLSH